jgi:hypothetical protein
MNLVAEPARGAAATSGNGLDGRRIPMAEVLLEPAADPLVILRICRRG